MINDILSLFIFGRGKGLFPKRWQQLDLKEIVLKNWTSLKIVKSVNEYKENFRHQTF